MPQHPHCREFLPNIQSTPPIFHFGDIPHCPVNPWPYPKFLSTSLGAPVGTGKGSNSHRSLLFSMPSNPSSHSLFLTFGGFLWPPLDLLQQLPVLPVTRTPGPDTVLHVEFHLSGTEEDNPPSPVAHAASDTAQDMGGFPGLPAHLVRSYPASRPPRFLSSGLLSIPSPASCTSPGNCPDPCANPVLGFVYPHKFPRQPCPWTGQPGQPTLVQVLLGAIHPS